MDPLQAWIGSGVDDDEDRRRYRDGLGRSSAPVSSYRLDPFCDGSTHGERASLTGRYDDELDGGSDGSRGRRWSKTWLSVATVAATLGAFALGVAAGGRNHTGLGVMTNQVAEMSSASRVRGEVENGHDVARLGMTQYQRTMERGRRAAPRRSSNAGSQGGAGGGAAATNETEASGVEESEYSADAYDDAGGLFGGMFDEEVDGRPVIKGVSAELEEERAKIIKDDENKMGYLRFPSLSNDKLTFVSESNIWIGSIKGGKASRLSSTYSREGAPVLSPDGSRVAFVALTYDGYDVFIAPTDGGASEQITTGGRAQDIASWPEDDEILIVSSAFSKMSNPQLVKLNPATRVTEPLPLAQAVTGAKDIFRGCYIFVPLRQSSETKRYEGGEQSRLWKWCSGTPHEGNKTFAEAKNLTPEESWGVRGAWNPETSKALKLKDFIFFLSDKEDVANVWVMKSDGSVAKSLTDECIFDIKEFTIDGTTLVYRRLGGLFKRSIRGDNVTDLSLSEEAPIEIDLVSEFRKTAPERIEDPYSQMSEFVSSTDGAFGAFVIRGQVFYSSLLPFLGSRIEKVSSYNGAVRYKHIQFVPDESADGLVKILALSDASGEYEYVMFERRTVGGVWKETQITTGGKIKGAMGFSVISPDSKALILADTSGQLKLINLTMTAVNTAEYRTTVPEKIPVELAQRTSKMGLKNVAKDTEFAQIGDAKFPKDVNLKHKQGARKGRRVASARVARTQRRAARHLASIGSSPAAQKWDSLSGLADVQSMIDGLRPEGISGLSWSPDSSHIAYAKDEGNDFTTINVLELATKKEIRITSPSYNAHSPKFSPDGMYLYYFSDQQITSGSNSPYGSRGSEPALDSNERLMCVPLRMGMTCPFFIGDELNSEGTVFGAEVGEALKTVISTPYIEQRAQVVPELPEAIYFDFDLISDGSGILLTLLAGREVYVAVYSMYTRQLMPLYPNPIAVVVSRDLKIVTLVTEVGVALMSAQQLLQNGLTQDMAISSAQVWSPPESFSVIVNPREEWLQMYEEAMRNMRDAFYDPNLHGVDWVTITDRYRPSVYLISSKAELRDILAQAFGELSALHVFVKIHSDDPLIPFGEPTACLGGDFKIVSQGLRIERVHDNTGILESPSSPLRSTSDTTHVNLMPGDIITRIDGVFVNSTLTPLPDLLAGKAGMQVLLEVIKAPRSEIELRDAEDLLKLQQMMQMQQMMGGGMAKDASKLGGQGLPTKDSYVASLVRKYANLGAAKKHKGHHSTAHLKAKEKDDAKDENDGPKTELIVVTPLDLGSCDTLQAADALNIRREKVKNATNDRVAYVYLEDMEQEGEGSSNSFDDFAAQFYPNIRKEGIIIDVRRNAGGNIDTWLLERLRRVAWMFDTERSGPGDTTMQYSFRGKVVVLIDEQTSSDAEMFALGIQQLKIGPVIGERTWGGAIGYSGHPELRLVDGSGFTIPSFGPYLNGAWAIEQKGVTPDIAVSNLPVATYYGADAQLDKAIEVIQDLITKAEDVALPSPPEYPNRAVDVNECSTKTSQSKLFYI